MDKIKAFIAFQIGAMGYIISLLFTIFLIKSRKRFHPLVIFIMIYQIFFAKRWNTFSYLLIQEIW